MNDSDHTEVPTTLKSPGGLDVMMPLCAVFRRHLKSHDLKYTRERADILNLIMETDDVFEADSILEEMRKRGDGSSKATVYRTLKLLQDAKAHLTFIQQAIAFEGRGPVDFGEEVSSNRENLSQPLRSLHLASGAFHAQVQPCLPELTLQPAERMRISGLQQPGHFGWDI